MEGLTESYSEFGMNSNTFFMAIFNKNLNRLCGTSSELYREQTSAGVFIVVFRSDGQDQAAGFDFSWGVFH